MREAIKKEVAVRVLSSLQAIARSNVNLGRANQKPKAPAMTQSPGTTDSIHQVLVNYGWARPRSAAFEINISMSEDRKLAELSLPNMTRPQAMTLKQLDELILNLAWVSASMEPDRR